MPSLAHANSVECLTALRRERTRVRRHLAGAEGLARRRRVGLDPVVALNRALLLDELARYRRGGRFPRNIEPGSVPAPQFIDASGTRCAVAHLMEMSGQGAIVRHIAQSDNGARVRELARLPELRAWLAAAGLSLDEAARIQPTYCHETQAFACFCSQGAQEGVAVGTVLSSVSGTVRVRIDRVDGELDGLVVGEERAVASEVSLPGIGERLLLGRQAVDLPLEPGGALYRIGPLLELRGERVTCEYDAQTARRPVRVDTAITALLAERDDCVNVLAQDDSDWNISTCSDVENESGCGLASASSDALASSGLTSLAVLGALILQQRRRRRA